MTSRKWLGWLDIVERQQHWIWPRSLHCANDIHSTGFTHALLLGMGGSSLCPEVLSLTYGQQPGFPKLHIVDSTDPAQVAAARAAVDLKKTICIVSSKSGSTLEPNILKDYFFSEMSKGRWRGRGWQALHRGDRSQARRWSRSPWPTASATSSMVTRPSADASRRCRTSASCRPL